MRIPTVPARLLPVLLSVGCGTLGYYGLDDPEALGDTGLSDGAGNDDDDDDVITTPGEDDDGALRDDGPNQEIDCADGQDDDGDGDRDCDDPDCDDVCDGDGDGSLGIAYGGDDCDDSDRDVHPGAAETCDGVDSDCDGADCADVVEGFETGTLTAVWLMLGDADWSVHGQAAHTGAYGAKSGAISDNEETTLQVELDFPSGGTVEFWTTGDTELRYDILEFAIDNAPMQEWSGTWGWEQVSFTVPAGTHILSWRYSKDESLDGGGDRAAIDDILLVGASL